MTEQLTTFVDMMAHLDLDAYMPLPEPHRQTFHTLRRLRAQAQAGDNQALLQALLQPKQPDEIIRVYAASMIVASKLNPAQLEILGRALQTDKNNSVRIALAKKLKDIPSSPDSGILHSQVVSWLLQAVTHGQNLELRVIAAESARDTGIASWETWQEKVGEMLKLLEHSEQYREHLDIAALITAVSPAYTIIQTAEDRNRLADLLIAKSPKYNQNPRLIGILAALIIQSCDHNLQRVVHRINRFIETNPQADDELTALRVEINSLLTPAELQSAFKESYEVPLKTMQQDVRYRWKMSILSAQLVLLARLAVNLFAAGIGLWLLYRGADNLSNQDTWPISFMQIGLGLILLLIFLVYRGTVRDAKQALVDINVANTVYAAFAQQSLDISYRYTTLSLQNRLSNTEMQTSNQLMAETMKNAILALRNEHESISLEDFLTQFD